MLLYSKKFKFCELFAYFNYTLTAQKIKKFCFPPNFRLRSYNKGKFFVIYFRHETLAERSQPVTDDGLV